MSIEKSEWVKSRFVLLQAPELGGGWFIWDRLRYRMSDGVYFNKRMAQGVCDYFNEDHARGDRDWYAKERTRYANRTWEQWQEEHA